ncbi:fibronectin type III domain-containing protein [Actinoplanes aureus]|uniref:Fibronectin type III domain-containing protein n=1 Tax=Actinoplanes aureus TaxID=2792083 RepID=A0A931G1B5_9ACTN|nr:fibronectin type III domain-containing protein [Actinoplanes aureus]MBG0566532.1 fibronectin type III domain-containing protein [Actinoplanes aureus]
MAAPGKPTGFSAAPGDGTLTLTFQVADDGGSPITGYDYSTDNGTSWRQLANVTGTTTKQATVTHESHGGNMPLGHNIPYNVVVRAVNADGAGVPSDPFAVTIPPKAPDAPHSVTVSVEASAVTLGFSPPRDYGSPINAWEYTTDNGASWRPLTVSGTTQLSATITNQSSGGGSTALQPGQQYQLRLRALNAEGPGQDTQTFIVSLPNPGAPGAPTSVTAAAAGEGFGVDFTAPSPGDSAIVKYQYSTDDGGTWADATTTGTGPLRAVLEFESGGDFRFAHGRPYRIRIRAVNAQGAGMPSAAAEASLPSAPPGAPWDLAAVPRAEGGVTLGFGNPPDNGSPLTGWEYTTDDGAHWRPLTGVSGEMRLSAVITTESAGDGSTALRTGQPYRIRVRARNALGPGRDSQTASIVLPNPGAPEAPTSVTAAAAGEGFGVDFTAPSPGDSAIVKYQYSTDNGGTWADATITGTGPLHAVLEFESGGGFRFTHGRPYRIRIRAVNAQGAGMTSAAAEASLPAARPGAPWDLTAVPRAEGGAALSFGNPQDNGSPLTGFEYSTDDGAHWRPLTGVSGTMRLTAVVTTESTGDGSIVLRTGQSYRIRVRALNALGAGPDSQTVTVNLPNPGAPEAPTSVTAAAAGEGFGVDFTAPSPGDSAIVKYEYSTDDGNSWADATITGTGPLRAVLQVESSGDFRFAHGRPYRIRIRAVNAQGAGMPSGAAEASLPATAPEGPWDLRIQPGDRTMTLTFGVPPDNGSPITGWEYTTDDGAHWQPLSVTGDMRGTATIATESDGTTSLSNGMPYQVRIHALNDLGTGRDSETVTITLPNPGAPAAPAPVTAAPAGAGFGVDFTAPAPGDSAIVKYQYSTDGGSTWADVTTTGTGPLHAVLEAESQSGWPFARGTGYLISIRAVNDQGPGMPSDPVEAALDPTVPGAPVDLSAQVGDRAITLTWNKPTDSGSRVTGLEYSTDYGGTWRPLPPYTVNDDFSMSSTIITASAGDGTTPLQNGQTYYLRLRAVSELGTGQDSMPLRVELPVPGAPGRPASLNLSLLGNRFGVDFTAASPGDSAIVKYQYSTDDGETWADVAPTGTGPLHVEVSAESDTRLPLRYDHRYDIRLRAVNTQGAGPASDPVGRILAPAEPGAPSLITPTSGDRQVTVMFTAPPAHGATITGYDYSTDGGTTWWPLAGYTQLGPTTVRATIADLTNGIAYRLRLRASNEVGPGPASEAVTVTPYGAPGAPSGLTAVPGTAGATLTFAAPSSSGSEISGYEYSTDGGATWAALPPPSGTGTLTAVITTASGQGRPALTGGATYQVSVRAINAAGPGAPSPAAALTLSADVGAPRALTVAARNRAAALTFGAPADARADAITGYQVSVDNGKTWSGLSPAGGAGGMLTATVGNLSNDSTYQIQVRAVTAAGPGAATGAVSVTPLAPPAAPTAVVAAPQTATITVSWSAPAPGGAPVTGYTAIASPGPATCEAVETTTCVLGARADQPYTVVVVAHSASGDSIASAPSASVTAVPPAIPSTPPVADEQLGADGGADGDVDAVQPGETVTIRGSGYAPNSTVEVVVYSAPVSLGTVLTDDNGEFSLDIAVPANLAGTHSIVAVGADPDGNVRSMRLDVTVAPAPAPSPSPDTGGSQPDDGGSEPDTGGSQPDNGGDLPTTGNATEDMAVLGLFLMLLGAGLVRTSRLETAGSARPPAASGQSAHRSRDTTMFG